MTNRAAWAEIGAPSIFVGRRKRKGAKAIQPWLPFIVMIVRLPALKAGVGELAEIPVTAP